MLPISRSNRASAGFSLAEVLVALVIAALMAVVLTRYAAGSRMNAANVNQQIEMLRLNDSLFARVDAGAPLTPGVTGGRTGNLAWSVTVAPMPYSAAIVTRGKSEPEDTEEGASGDQFSSLLEQQRGGAEAAPEPKKKPRNWAVYRVDVVVESSRGGRVASSAIRSRPVAAQ